MMQKLSPIKAICAFTLVELLGVVAIIALLANIAVISTQGSVGASQEAVIKRQVQTLNSAYQSYLASGGTTPDFNDGSRGAMKADAVAITRILMEPFDTKGIGIIGPYMPRDTGDWITTIGGDEVISRKVLGVDNFIGFNGGNGFSFMGHD